MNVWTLISAIEFLAILGLVWINLNLEDKVDRAKTAIEDYNDRLGREYESTRVIE